MRKRRITTVVRNLGISTRNVYEIDRLATQIMVEEALKIITEAYEIVFKGENHERSRDEGGQIENEQRTITVHENEEQRMVTVHENEEQRMEGGNSFEKEHCTVNNQ